MIHGRVNAYLGFLKWWPSAILNFKIIIIIIIIYFAQANKLTVKIVT